MSALSRLLRSAEGGRVSFWCPGCKESHTIRVGAAESPNWSFDGNVDAPTFSPSVLVRSGHYADGGKGGCWCTYYQEHPDEPKAFTCGICHSFVRNGNIEFLGDCTHELAGKTVPLPAWPEGKD